MKTTINKKELIEFNACKDGLDLFVKTHGNTTVNLSQCFDSNSLDDVFWLLAELDTGGLLSAEQLKGLRLFAADCAESVLHIFESEYPDDKRPRLAIHAARDFANGLTGHAASAAASEAARTAAWGAASAAASVAASAAAWGAASAAARTAAGYAARAAASAAARTAAGYAAGYAARAAAGYAARAAASAAASDVQSKQLKSLLVKWEKGQ